MKHSPFGLLLAVAISGALACSSTDTGPDAGTGGDAGAGGEGGVGGSDVPSEWRIFVTSTGQSGNIGGIAGADAICANRAMAAGLIGEFKAWLSTDQSAVSDRITHASGPYVLVNGAMIAEDWDDLVDGTVLVPINLDETGTVRTGEAWTGTLATGGSYPDDDCAGFTSDSAGAKGLCGDPASTTSTWTENITPSCDTMLRLYCIEQ